jgi:hypothetical protein
MNQFPPKPRSIPLGPFGIFSKICGDIRSQGALPVSLTPVANEKKSSIRNVLIIFLEHLCVVELTHG